MFRSFFNRKSHAVYSDVVLVTLTISSDLAQFVTLSYWFIRLSNSGLLLAKTIDQGLIKFRSFLCVGSMAHPFHSNKQKRALHCVKADCCDNIQANPIHHPNSQSDAEQINPSFQTLIQLLTSCFVISIPRPFGGQA